MTDDSDLDQVLMELGLDLPLCEIAMPRGLAIHKIRSLADPIVDHMILLAIAPAGRSERSHWRGELVGLLGDVAGYRAKRTGLKPFPSRVYYDNLWAYVYDEPETEAEALRYRVDRMARKERITPPGDLAPVARELREFFRAYSTLCSKRRSKDELKQGIIDLLGRVRAAG